MNDSSHPLVTRLILDHELNPTLEKRTALRACLGISHVTQWRHEKRLGLKPNCYVGSTALFLTSEYLAAFVSNEKGAA